MELSTEEEKPGESSNKRAKAKCSISDVAGALQRNRALSETEHNESPLVEILEIADHLQGKHAMLTDSLTKDGHPILVMYANPQFQAVSDKDFTHTMEYLINVTSHVWKNSQVTIIVDRKKDNWSAVKCVLQALQAIPTQKVVNVLILKPVGFFKNIFGGGDMKQLQAISHHQIVILSSDEDLLHYVDVASLPVELGGNNDFDHMEWIEHKTAVERFQITCRKIQSRLKYLRKLYSKRELLSCKQDIEEIAASHRQMLSDVEDDISCTKDIAETLETIVIKPLRKRETTPLYQHNIDCLNQWISSLQVMRDELEEVWESQDKYLGQCMSLCSFEQDFCKVSKDILEATGEVTGRVDIGETMEIAEELMTEYQEFKSKTETPHDDIKELHERGQKMLDEGHFAQESIEVRVEEIDKICSRFERLSEQRRDLLQTNIDVLLCLQQLNDWCKNGVDLLASQPIDRFQTVEGANNALKEIDNFITNQKGISLAKMNKLPSMCRKLDNKVIDELVKASLRRIEEVKEMFSKRESSLKKLSSKIVRPVQPVLPQSVEHKDEDAKTGRPQAPPRKRSPTQSPRKTSDCSSSPTKMDRKNIEIVVTTQPQRPKRNLSLRRSFKLKRKGSDLTADDLSEEGAMRRKMRQVVKELLETEYAYVEDLKFVVEDYYKAFDDPIYDIPAPLRKKKNVIFGNIVDIFNFHNDTFLTELKKSDGTAISIGRIFTEKKEEFQLYAFYCQNKPNSEVVRQELQNTAFAKECQSRLGHQLPLDSYLLKPVQRITKYQLLIGEMMKYTGKKGPAYQELQEALGTMKKVLRHLNDIMHSSGLVGYLDNINDLGKLLLQDTFIVWEIHKSMLKQISNLRGKHRQAFLYESAIILSKKELKETDSGKEDYVYQFKDQINVSEVGLTENVKGDPTKFELLLRGGKEIHVMQAKTELDKKAWVDEIRRLLLLQRDVMKEKVTSRHQGMNLQQPSLYSDPMWRNSAPNLPQLMSPGPESADSFSSSNTPPRRKFSFNNAISTPKLEQTLESLEVRQLSETRSSSDTQLWSPEDGHQPKLLLAPASDYDGESDDGLLWSDTEFDDYPDDSNDLEEHKRLSKDYQESLSSGVFDSQSQGSRESREIFVAIADYLAVEESELSFNSGDCLELLEYGEEGWWFMENTLNGRQGWAPASYVVQQNKGSHSGGGHESKDSHFESTNGGRLETTV